MSVHDAFLYPIRTFDLTAMANVQQGAQIKPALCVGVCVVPWDYNFFPCRSGLVTHLVWSRSTGLKSIDKVVYRDCGRIEGVPYFIVLTKIEKCFFFNVIANIRVMTKMFFVLLLASRVSGQYHRRTRTRETIAQGEWTESRWKVYDYQRKFVIVHRHFWRSLTLVWHVCVCFSGLYWVIVFTYVSTVSTPPQSTV